MAVTHTPIIAKFLLHLGNSMQRQPWDPHLTVVSHNVRDLGSLPSEAAKGDNVETTCSSELKPVIIA